MAESQESNPGLSGDGEAHEVVHIPASLTVARKGIKSSSDFCEFYAAMISDVVSGQMTPQQANAACNGGDKIIKMLDLERKYGTRPDSPRRSMRLALESNGKAE